MLKWSLLAAILFPATAMAEGQPSPSELLSKYKIQLGQMLVEVGSLELENAQLKKDLAAAKATSKPAPDHLAPH